jgi:MtN3 and saliva related transmembrane protein
MLLDLVVPFFGYLGATLYLVAELPQIYKAFKTKSISDISFVMLFLWFLGALCMTLYVSFTSCSGPVLFSYIVGAITSFILLHFWFKYNG